MAEVLETQEQFPVQAGIQNVDETHGIKYWTPAFTGNRSCVSSISAIHGGHAGVTNTFSAAC
jgi:hypothetical protein